MTILKEDYYKYNLKQRVLEVYATSCSNLLIGRGTAMTERLVRKKQKQNQIPLVRFLDNLRFNTEFLL